jgi:tetratricopeptide (TPR) repeat protein
LKDGNREAACDLLENADAGNNQALLFFAARTLGENGRNQAALDKYSRFTPESPYYAVVLLNMAEILAEMGDNARALELSRAAYLRYPDSPQVQLCPLWDFC